MGYIEFSLLGQLILRGRGPWDSQASYGTWGPDASWAHYIHMNSAAKLAKVGRKTQKLWFNTMRDSRETCDVCPARLWLKEGHTRHALSHWAMRHATAAQETPADAHGPLGLWVQWKAVSFDLDISQWGRHHYQYLWMRKLRLMKLATWPKSKNQ